jgi:hypothetical protein
MSQVPVRGGDLMGKIAQAESLRSARDVRLAASEEAKRTAGMRSATAEALQGKEGGMNKLMGYGDAGAVSQVSDAISKQSEGEFKKNKRINELLARAAATSNSPVEFASNIDYLSSSGSIPRETAQKIRGAWDQRSIIMGVAEEYNRQADRIWGDVKTQEERLYKEQQGDKERKAEIAKLREEKRLEGEKPVYPSEDNMDMAVKLLKEYMPDVHPSETLKAHLGTLINRNLNRGMDYATASREALSEIQPGLIDERHDPWGAGDWDKQYTIDKPMSENRPGFSYKGSSVTAIDSDPQRGVLVQDENGRKGWIKVSLEDLEKYLSR